jgi:hypothetical protein
MGKRIAGLVIILTVSYAAASMAGTVQLPQTGQTTCYDTAGIKLTSCAGTGQDGDFLAGVTWPIPRFQTGSGPEADCIVDNLTGLMWQKNADPTERTWQEALDYVKTLNNTETPCGHNDWRLPNVNELESLNHAGQANTAIWLTSQGFSGIVDNYWSSTSHVYYPGYAYHVDLRDGYSTDYLKTATAYTLAVRGTTSGQAQVWQTGQTTCYDASGNLVDCVETGQDGEQLKGAAWPTPRFTVQGDCITDDLTGLTWTKSPAANEGTWQQGLDYANSFTLCGYSDWRLPNRNELGSLIHYGVAEPAVWLNGQGFTGVSPNYYWSSTTYEASPSWAWYHKIGDAYQARIDKTLPLLYTLLVRSGAEGTIGTEFTIGGAAFGTKKGQVLLGPLTIAGDNFNDNSKDRRKWGKDEVTGHGVMTEINQRLEYRCGTGTTQDGVDRSWVLTGFPYNADWVVKIDAVNLTSPSAINQVSSFGIDLFSPRLPDNEIYAELYASRLGGQLARGFYTELFSVAPIVGETWADSGDLGVTSGAVLIVFGSTEKVITVYYAINPGDGYQWVQCGSFGVSGATGKNGNTDWGLTDTDQLALTVYGYSERMTITAGKLFGDNFMEYGGTGVVSFLKQKARTWNDSTINSRIKKVPFIAGTYDITIKPKPYTTTPITLSNAFTVKGPEIISVSSGSGKPDDKITITGKFFGTIQGKVYLEYQKDGKPKRKYCAVTSWTMNPATGVSEIKFRVPKGLGPATYPLKVGNKVGVAEATLGIDQ